QFDELANFVAHEVPGPLHVPNQRVRLVLGQHTNLADAGIDTVGQDKVDDAVFAAKGHSRLGPPLGQRAQATALAASQHQSQSTACQPADRLDLGEIIHRYRPPAYELTSCRTISAAPRSPGCGAVTRYTGR